MRLHLRSLLLKIGFERVTIVPFDWLHPFTPASLIGPVSVMGQLLEKLPLVREFSGSLYLQGFRPAFELGNES